MKKCQAFQGQSFSHFLNHKRTQSIGQLQSQRKRSACGVRPIVVSTRNVVKLGSAAGEPNQQAPDPPSEGKEKPATLLQRMTKFFTGDKLDATRMAQLGIGFTAAYGMLSNLVYITGMSVTWVIYVKRYHKTPLFPGEWKAFLLFYAGFWTINNFIRPFRVALAISMAPVFDTTFSNLAERFSTKKRVVIFWYFAFFAVASFALLFGVIALFGGPHAFATKPWI